MTQTKKKKRQLYVKIGLLSIKKFILFCLVNDLYLNQNCKYYLLQRG